MLSPLAVAVLPEGEYPEIVALLLFPFTVAVLSEMPAVVGPLTLILALLLSPVTAAVLLLALARPPGWIEALLLSPVTLAVLLKPR